MGASEASGCLFGSAIKKSVGWRDLRIIISNQHSSSGTTSMLSGRVPRGGGWQAGDEGREYRCGGGGGLMEVQWTGGEVQWSGQRKG